MGTEFDTYLIALIWCIYASLEGYRDARTFANGTSHYIKQNSKDLHPTLLLFRVFLFLVFTLLIISSGLNLVSMIKTGAGLALLFPFFHLGIYYAFRKAIDSPNGYPSTIIASFTHRSRTTTAKTNLSFWQRLLLFLLGCALIY